MHMADLLDETLRSMGCVVSRHSLSHHSPLLVARYEVSPVAPTIGIYGHYDVQPADPVDLWSSPPFTLTRHEGKLVGRGIADNKGHIVQHIAALHDLIRSHSLTHNIVVVLEGEEETGSPHLESLIGMVPDKRLTHVDVWLVTDVGSRGTKKPQIFHALRGIFTGELVIQTSSHDAHSGVYGNRIYNSAQILSDIVSSLHDRESGLVAVPGFYEGMIVPSDVEYQALVAQADTPDTIMSRSGAYILPPVSRKYPNLPQDMPVSLASKLAPSCDINGLYSGYSGEGSKTVIPASAGVKFSCRIVPGQKVSDIQSKVESYLLAQIPTGVRRALTLNAGSDPFYTAIDDPWMKRISHILGDFAGSEVTFNRSGGSIPAAEILSRTFGRPVILTGFTLPDDRIHAPDENFDEEMFWWGIDALKRIYSSKVTR